jgi:hypothetical protein
LTEGDNGMSNTVSVLMATYAGETAYRLERSLDSMFAQTQAPNELVLIVDGLIGVEQMAIIEVYKKDQRIPKFCDVHLPANPWYRHIVLPGITGWAQVDGWREDTSDIQQIEQRVAHDFEYIAMQSFRLDPQIILRTLTHELWNIMPSSQIFGRP